MYIYIIIIDNKNKLLPPTKEEVPYMFLPVLVCLCVCYQDYSKIRA